MTEREKEIFLRAAHEKRQWLEYAVARLQSAALSPHVKKAKQKDLSPKKIVPEYYRKTRSDTFQEWKTVMAEAHPGFLEEQEEREKERRSIQLELKSLQEQGQLNGRNAAGLRDILRKEAALKRRLAELDSDD